MSEATSAPSGKAARDGRMDRVTLRYSRTTSQPGDNGASSPRHADPKHYAHGRDVLIVSRRWSLEASRPPGSDRGPPTPEAPWRSTCPDRTQLGELTPSILTFRKRAGAAPWLISAICMGLPFPQFTMPCSSHSDGPATASQLRQNGKDEP